MSDEQRPAPGWYPDVEVPGGERYWDGAAWTEHRRPGPAAGSPWGTAPGAAPSWAGASWATAGPTQPIDTWLWQSIVATIFCCQPLGIVGIVMSAQAGSARDAGNYALAQRRADQARTWTLAAVGVGLAFVLGFVLLGVMGAVLGA